MGRFIHAFAVVSEKLCSDGESVLSIQYFRAVSDIPPSAVCDYELGQPGISKEYPDIFDVPVLPDAGVILDSSIDRASSIPDAVDAAYILWNPKQGYSRDLDVHLVNIVRDVFRRTVWNEIYALPASIYGDIVRDFGNVAFGES